MADVEALRVQVRLSAELHPELFTALVSMRPRGRADRLRQLALLGLTGHRAADSSDSSAAGSAALPATPVEDRVAPANPKRARILGTLTLAD